MDMNSDLFAKKSEITTSLQ